MAAAILEARRPAFGGGKFFDITLKRDGQCGVLGNSLPASNLTN